jgi:hypothetical protein
MAEFWGFYLAGNFFFGLLWFLLALWISRAAPSGAGDKFFVRAGKIILFTLLIVSVLINVVLLTRNIPPRMNGYVLGDGLCDYTGKPASLGLFEVVRGDVYVDGQQQHLISYEVRPLSDLRNDTLVTEYSSGLEWLAILDKERMSNGWLIKTVILVASIGFLVIAASFNGVFKKARTGLPVDRGQTNPAQ